MMNTAIAVAIALAVGAGGTALAYNFTSTTTTVCAPTAATPAMRNFTHEGDWPMTGSRKWQP